MWFYREFQAVSFDKERVWMTRIIM